jgi:hypothetical protein
MGRTYTRESGRNSDSFLKQVAVAVVASIIVIVIVIPVYTYATTNTTLTVELQYKGNSVSGSVRVSNNQGMQQTKNGSSPEFSLPDGVYYVSAFFTNSSGTYSTNGYWTLDLSHGNIIFGTHMTIEFYNDTAWW